MSQQIIDAITIRDLNTSVNNLQSSLNNANSEINRLSGEVRKGNRMIGERDATISDLRNELSQQQEAHEQALSQKDREVDTARREQSKTLDDNYVLRVQLSYAESRATQLFDTVRSAGLDPEGLIRQAFEAGPTLTREKAKHEAAVQRIMHERHINYEQATLERKRQVEQDRQNEERLVQSDQKIADLSKRVNALSLDLISARRALSDEKERQALKEFSDKHNSKPKQKPRKRFSMKKIWWSLFWLLAIGFVVIDANGGAAAFVSIGDSIGDSWDAVAAWLDSLRKVPEATE